METLALRDWKGGARRPHLYARSAGMSQPLERKALPIALYSSAVSVFGRWSGSRIAGSFHGRPLRSRSSLRKTRSVGLSTSTCSEGCVVDVVVSGAHGTGDKRATYETAGGCSFEVRLADDERRTERDDGVELGPGRDERPGRRVEADDDGVAARVLTAGCPVVAGHVRQDQDVRPPLLIYRRTRRNRCRRPCRGARRRGGAGTSPRAAFAAADCAPRFASAPKAAAC
jgi:hypothetical protein